MLFKKKSLEMNSAYIFSFHFNRFTESKLILLPGILKYVLNFPYYVINMNDELLKIY